MPNRREFLASLATTGSLIALGAARRSQAVPLLGTTAGEERTIHGIRFCWCPAGRFTMGSPETEPGRRFDEQQVEVTLTKGFWTAKFEVTQGQWQRIVGAFPNKPPAAEFGIGDDLPLYWVNYPSAETFCAKATEAARKSGELPSAWAFRLPTEAQWEYACRAGTTTATAFGDSLGRDRANFGETVYNGGRDAPRVGKSAPVGQYPPNAWKIHDMHGNVWEWCRDWYHSRLPGGTDPDVIDVKGIPNRDGSYSRVRRGGAWIEEGAFCRSALRLRYEPERVSDHIGFRVVLVQV
jgi:sulfatase modifying factor 1